MTRDELFRRSWNDSTYGDQVVLLKDAYDYADAVVQEKQDAIDNIIKNYPHNAVYEAFLAGKSVRDKELAEQVTSTAKQTTQSMCEFMKDSGFEPIIENTDSIT